MTERLPIEAKFSSRHTRRDTRQVLDLLATCQLENDAIVDIGCGAGYVLWQLAEQGSCSDLVGVDIVDVRRAPVPEFLRWDGRHIPVDDGRFDIAMLNFVLHHVPNQDKPALLEEARRITKRRILIMEDTPVNAFDRYFSRRHGETYRQQIGTESIDYGFYTKDEWEELFATMGLTVHLSQRLGRFSRHWMQPYARSVFVLGA